MARPKTHRFEEITLEQIKLLQVKFKEIGLHGTASNVLAVAVRDLTEKHKLSKTK
jgi:hypothetical protein